MMDTLSTIMEDSESLLNQCIAARVRELRAAQGLSLEALAAKSGVSRSMISLVERGESSPTAVLLEKLASGLGTVLANLFEAPAAAGSGGEGPVSRRATQAEWRDPASGYIRRNVSPPGPQPVQLVEVHFPPGARVAFESAGGQNAAHQQVWLLEGAMDITAGAQRHQLRQGDCLAMTLDHPVMFHNPTRQAARYVVALVHPPGARR